MSSPVTERPNVAFYHNRNKLRVEREINFRPDLAAMPEGWDLDEVIPARKMGAYRELCKRAISLTTRLMFLPREASYMRSMIHVDQGQIVGSKPTGGYVEITGTNFKSSFHMGDVDSRDFGLAHYGTDEKFAEIGRTATVGSFIRDLDDANYFHLEIGPNACLADSGVSVPTRIVQPEFVEEWIETVLKPLESDVKAQAYEWTGDGKTMVRLPDRIV